MFYLPSIVGDQNDLSFALKDKTCFRFAYSYPFVLRDASDNSVRLNLKFEPLCPFYHSGLNGTSTQ